MKTRHTREGSRRLALAAATVLTLAATTTMVGARATSDSPASTRPGPTLIGRAVLPADTIAGPPVSGQFMPPGNVNGITFPLAGQPVAGFSAIVEGSRRGEYLAMADNGFGSKANSPDFLIRAYAVRPFFKTARGGSGTVRVGGFVSFRDPHRQIGFPIVNEATTDRLLTGADIDPESLQRGRRHDLWMGDEFGPWILHFDARGRLLDPPFAMPRGIVSPNNPLLDGAPAWHRAHQADDPAHARRPADGHPHGRLRLSRRRAGWLARCTSTATTPSSGTTTWSPSPARWSSGSTSTARSRRSSRTPSRRRSTPRHRRC